MKVSAATCRPPARKRFPLALGTNEAAAIAMKFTDVTCSAIMSQDGFAPVIRRCIAFHGSLSGELYEIQGVVGEKVDTLAEIVQIRAEPDKMAVTKLQLTGIVDLRFSSVFVAGYGRPRAQVRGRRLYNTIVHPIEAAAFVTRRITRRANRWARELGGAGCERSIVRAGARSTIWRFPIRVQLNSFVWQRNRKPGEYHHE
ncbi:hypothetical protein KIP88_40320 [Bradyrhizobium sp. SRL28]|uniref:hypothetical protein n=1 Tax=Bradyrhizobium sp. SRL28 TaxID=2836178 RepID=UPI001BDE389B|nr:hypothetical protein [Bradyrhizobium sp. SRL28]MBT1516669.1 hypothetical protein [Bradyrhizobium sp. SRL28]